MMMIMKQNKFKQTELIPSLFYKGQNSNLLSNWPSWPETLQNLAWVIPLGSSALTLCPGLDQEIHQACGFSMAESVDTKNLQHFGWFKCTFIIVAPLLFPHCPGIRHLCLNYVLFRMDASTTHSARATPASWTHRTYCSVPFLPRASLPVPPAGRAGKWLPREPLIIVINALSCTQFHQSSPTHQSQTIVLCTPFFPLLFA